MEEQTIKITLEEYKAYIYGNEEELEVKNPIGFKTK